MTCSRAAHELFAEAVAAATDATCIAVNSDTVRQRINSKTWLLSRDFQETLEFFNDWLDRG